MDEVKQKLTTEGIPKRFKTRLAPFLFDDEDVRKLDMFAGVMEKLCQVPDLVDR
jgi:hypothetical protein